MTDALETTSGAVAPQAAPARGRRSAAPARARLLAAAAELFGEEGYDATTVRAIGRRAAVDPALIARYFGSKADLYLESLRIGSPDEPSDLTDPRAVEDLLERVTANRIAPSVYTVVQPHDDVELQAAAMGMLERRVTAPIEARARAQGTDDARLRAEIATAALAGIVIARVSGTLPTIATATAAEVAQHVAALVATLVDDV